MSRSDNTSKPETVLLKWHLIRVWFPEFQPKHFKYCICICPERRWFYFINSDPPLYRKARELALAVSRFEVTPLKHDSYIDTTDLVQAPDDGRVKTALADPDCCYGFISPSLKKKIMAAVAAHEALPEEQEDAVLFDGEPE
jgi:hypothetical protein